MSKDSDWNSFVASIRHCIRFAGDASSEDAHNYRSGSNVTFDFLEFEQKTELFGTGNDEGRLWHALVTEREEFSSPEPESGSTEHAEWVKEKKEYDDNVKLAKEGNKKALQYLGSTVVEDAWQIISGMTDAHEAWEALIETYNPEDDEDVGDLIAKFPECKLETNGDPQKWFLVLQSLLNGSRKQLPNLQRANWKSSHTSRRTCRSCTCHC